MMQSGPGMGVLWTLFMAITSAMFHTSHNMTKVCVRERECECVSVQVALSA